MEPKNYFYDGSWNGILTVFGHIIDSNVKEGGIFRKSDEPMQEDMFSEKVFIKTDCKMSAETADMIIGKCGSAAYNMIMWAFLSEKKLVENQIFEFLLFVFEAGMESSLLLSDDRVMRVYSAAQQVKKEVHRFKGFIRFEEIKPSIFYAAIEPDNNIVMLLAPHFKNRFVSQDWIIHDKKRGSAVFYDKTKCVYREIISFEFTEGTHEEKEYKFMWTKYFEAMGIRERFNPGLQRQFVPIKYRKNMTEFKKSVKK
jgi:probable DNA metabolism protein